MDLGEMPHYSVAYLERNAYAATLCSKFFLNVSSFYYREYYSHDPINTYRGILMLTGSDSKSGSVDFKKKVVTSKWIIAQLPWPDFSKHWEAYVLKRWALYRRISRQKHNINSFKRTW